MHPLFQAGQGGSLPTPALSAKSLRVERIPFETAAELNRAWHSRLPRFGTGAVKGRSAAQRFLCHGAAHDDRLYAVSIWSAPAARELPQQTWLELRRLAAAPDAPRNTCSRMLCVMELLIRRGRPEIVRLVSYQDTEAHTGAIYRAAGWVEADVKRGAEWDCPSRPRPKAQSTSDKQRWDKVLTVKGKAP